MRLGHELGGAQHCPHPQGRFDRFAFIARFWFYGETRESMSLRQRLRQSGGTNEQVLAKIRSMRLGRTRGEGIKFRRGQTGHVQSKEDQKHNRLALGRVKLVQSVTDQTLIPAANQPEIALAGRSNVGKSSLLNAITGKRAGPTSTTGIARVKNLPGVTRTLDFYGATENDARVVDMPGYGYAFAPKGSEAVWQGMMREYVLRRGPQLRLLLCVDARQSLRHLDRDFLLILDRESGVVPVFVVMTKCDLVKPVELAQRYSLLEQDLSDLRIRQLQGVFMVSSRTMAGISQLREELSKFMPVGWLRKRRYEDAEMAQSEQTRVSTKEQSRKRVRGRSNESDVQLGQGVNQKSMVHNTLEAERRKTRASFEMWVKRLKKRGPKMRGKR